MNFFLPLKKMPMPLYVNTINLYCTFFGHPWPSLRAGSNVILIKKEKKLDFFSFWHVKKNTHGGYIFINTLFLIFFVNFYLVGVLAERS